MNIKDIVEKNLKDNGYDGLYNSDDCGCQLSDFMPCDQPSQFCEPAYKVDCDCSDADCTFHMVTEKPGASQ